MSITVIVVAYRSSEHLRWCVEPLVDHPDVHVIVVDNACPDESWRTVADLELEVVHAGANRGFAAGCNVGLTHARGDAVLLLNPDARIEPDALIPLRQRLEDRPDNGIAVPAILEDDGEIALSLRRFPRLRSTYAQALFLHRVWPLAPWVDELVREPEAYRTPGEFEWASGAAMLVRRDLLDALGGLDDGFFLYCEDIDLCRRTRDRGYRVVFEPNAVVTHHGGGSGSRDAHRHLLVASRVRYAGLYHSAPYALAERAGIALGEMTHALVSLARGADAAGYLAALRASVRRRTAA